MFYFSVFPVEYFPLSCMWIKFEFCRLLWVLLCNLYSSSSSSSICSPFITAFCGFVSNLFSFCGVFPPFTRSSLQKLKRLIPDEVRLFFPHASVPSVLGSSLHQHDLTTLSSINPVFTCICYVTQPLPRFCLSPECWMMNCLWKYFSWQMTWHHYEWIFLCINGYILVMGISLL